MAKKLSVQVIGAPLKRDLEASTVRDLKKLCGQEGDVSAIVNQKPVTDNHELKDGDFVVFTQNIKGAMSWDEEEDEEAKSNVVYVWQSPTLAIVRLGNCGYRVNGQRVTQAQLSQLFFALEKEVDRQDDTSFSDED